MSESQISSLEPARWLKEFGGGIGGGGGGGDFIFDWDSPEVN